MREGGFGRWIALGVVMVLAFVTFAWLTTGNDESSGGGERAAAIVAGPDQLGEALQLPAGMFRKSNPPVDVDAIERSARSLTLDRVPLPDEHDVVTHRRMDTGAEITQIVLQYDDPSSAESLDGLAASLLAGAFHLETKPTTVEGAQDARIWWADAYLAISFRRGGTVVFVGSTDVGSEEQLRALAAQILGRIGENPPVTAAAPAQDG